MKNIFLDEGKCIHYNGTVNNKCAVGVDYESVAQPGEGILFSRLPCFMKNDLAGLGLCTECQYPTEQQIAESQEWLAGYIAKMAKAREAIKTHLEETGALRRNVSGVIACPHCGGKLSFSYAGAYNKHIHASCENSCVNWME